MGSVTESRIVVGVDGSSSSRRALGWAVEQARLTGAVVDAVACWVYPTMYGVVMAKPESRADQEAGRMLARAVAEVVGDRPPAEVRQSVLLGNAAEELLARAHGADLLVLGRREHHAFVNVLAGSVSQYCLQRARCPVVLIRDPEGH
ncbi:universal stress protein [Kitasatospora kifunensis]|uniref:Nucleotide-binding universal stress UspA family protein n=1 Tax=Kitasatospora kifunensis TaxID=58351 RepID=A0A7W7R977_KITKI|nr:universal stress protein [Kitasatospora kifunensis]MBB4927654.1 nucleotide-binding universal stress UspA family protein [Kitasatospora kifunensis]